jgi:hypothetical protein
VATARGYRLRHVLPRHGEQWVLSGARQLGRGEAPEFARRDGWKGWASALVRTLRRISAAASSITADDYVLALAQGVTGMLAIAYALVALVAERTVRKHRARDLAYRTNLWLLVLSSVASTLLSALAWWCWAHVAPDVDLLFDLPVAVWLDVMFGGAVVTGLCLGVFAGYKLVQIARASHQSGGWQA